MKNKPSPGRCAGETQRISAYSDRTSQVIHNLWISPRRVGGALANRSNTLTCEGLDAGTQQPPIVSTHGDTLRAPTPAVRQTADEVGAGHTWPRTPGRW